MKSKETFCSSILIFSLLINRKVIKAMSLFTNLIEAKLSADNSQEFFLVLSSLMNSLPLDLNKHPTENSINSLMKVVYQHEALFHPQNQFEIRTWYLQTVIAPLLRGTDDSYLFNKSCKFVSNEFSENYFIKKKQLDGDDETPPSDDPNNSSSLLPSDLSPLTDTSPPNDSINLSVVSVPPPSAAADPYFFSEEIKRSRLNAILLCLKICYQVYLRSGWTKQPIESLYLHITQRRLHIPFAELREQLDDLNTQLTQKQRKKLSGNGGVTQTIRTYNSSAHPLRTKKVGILR
jgi:hypothetical protein